MGALDPAKPASTDNLPSGASSHPYSGKNVVFNTPEEYPDVLGIVGWSEEAEAYTFSLTGVRFKEIVRSTDEAFFSKEVIGLVVNTLTKEMEVFAMKGLYAPGTIATGEVMLLKDWEPL